MSPDELDTAHVSEAGRRASGVASVFTHGSDGGFVASKLGRGPWDPGALHGGAPAALLMRAFEQHSRGEGLLIARVTYEILRPVPLAELEVGVEVVRGGRRVRLLEGVLSASGEPLVRARALLVSAAEGAPATPAVPPPPGPEHGAESGLEVPHRPMFTPDAIEIRYVAGDLGERGPATAWFRMRVPLLAGEQPSALQRLAAVGDFGNGISATVSWNDYLFINPDLTLYIDRVPAGEWICLDSQTRITDGGVGVSESTIYDRDGLVGRALQALLVAPR